MKKVIKQLPEIAHIWVPTAVAFLAVYFSNLLDVTAGSLDIFAYIQGCFIALCVFMFNNFFVNLGLKYNFKSEWKQYVDSLESGEFASFQFYCLWAFMHVMIVVIEAAIVL
jgi:hypothetical protein